MLGESREISWSFLKDKRDANGKRPTDDGYDATTILAKPNSKEKKFTPAQEQYWGIKSKHADMILFFKVGKFYELFEEDALIGTMRRASNTARAPPRGSPPLLLSRPAPSAAGHRELDLAFMGKEAPHVGFPEAVISKYAQKLVAIELTSDRASPPLTTHFSVCRYAQKLVAIGYKVGVVEQMETPQELKARNDAKRGCHYHHRRHHHHLHHRLHHRLTPLLPHSLTPPLPIGPQARNDAKPKGVKKESAVRRELCQVLTKGTAANADVDATYLLAVTEDVETGSIGVCSSTRRRRRSHSANASTTSTTRACAPSSRSSARPKS